MTGMEHVETPEFLRERLESFGTPRIVPAVLARLGATR